MTASAGNHGIGLAWGSKRLNLPCHVFLGAHVAERQAERIRAHGAVVHRVDGGYEASLQAARDAAAREGWSLVQDVDSEGYEQVPRDIYAGYTVLAREMTEAMEAPPTHVIVNAGVGARRRVRRGAGRADDGADGAGLPRARRPRVAGARQRRR